MSKKAAASNRRARALQAQAEHQRLERRRTFVIVGAAVAAAAVIVGWAVLALVREQQRQNAVDAAAQQPIEGVQTFKGLTRNHVNNPVDYPQTPSVGGDHAPVWANCGVYSRPLDPMQATHSLEHGAVWIGYDPTLDKAQISQLDRIGKANSFVLVSPVSGMSAPVTLSAWGAQLALQRADDPRLATFVKKYQVGPQTPEPGAPCSGGAGGM